MTLTKSQRAVLHSIKKTGYIRYHMSKISLIQKGLIMFDFDKNQYVLTDKGRKAIEEEKE